MPAGGSRFPVLVRHSRLRACLHAPRILGLAVIMTVIGASPHTAGASAGIQIAAVQPSPPNDEANRDTVKLQLQEALQSLKQSKQLGRVEAERILASIGPLQNARRNRKPPPPLEAALGSCVAAPSPVCLLQEAFAHAYRVPDEGRRDWALSAVASAFHDAGENERVYDVLALMDDPRTVLRLLGDTVAAEESTQLAGGKRETDDLGDPNDGSAANWVPAARSGNWDTAEREIETIPESRYRAVAWARFGRMAIDAGELAMADRALAESEALIEGIDLNYARSFAQYEASLTHIARVATSNRDLAETRKAAAATARIDQPHFRADAYWRLAAVGSTALTPEIEERAEQSFSEIASRLRKVFVLTVAEIKSDRRQDRALAIASTITDPLDRARAFTRLARYVR